MSVYFFDREIVVVDWTRMEYCEVLAVFQSLDHKFATSHRGQCYPLPNCCGCYILFFHRRISAMPLLTTVTFYVFLLRCTKCEFSTLIFTSANVSLKLQDSWNAPYNFSSHFSVANVELPNLLISLHSA